MARDLTQRLAALGRAHDLVRPVPGQVENKGALLGDLLATLLVPYDEAGAGGERIRISVPELRVGDAATTTLALVVHELATNSIKYGALSAARGRLEVSCPAHDPEVVLVWTERGGPPVAAPAAPGGFGSPLVTRSMSSRLGGSIAFDWRTEGLVATLRMSKVRLAT